MRDETISISTILAAIVFITFFTLACPADTSDQLELAKNYIAEGRYPDAIMTYQAVVNAEPDSDNACIALGEMATLYVKQGKIVETQGTYQELVSNYSNNPQISIAVDHIADAYRKCKDYAKARQLYQNIIETWPNAGNAMETYRGIAVTSAYLDDNTSALQAVDSIITKFSSNNKAGKAVYEIALECCDLNQYELANDVCQKFMSSQSQNEQAVWPLSGIAILNYQKADNQAARAAVTKLTADYAANPQLPRVLYNVARLCERSNKVPEAKEVYQKLINDFPEDGWTQRAKIDIACLNVAELIKNGSNTQAQTAYNEILTNYGDHPKISRTLFFIAEAYYKQAKGDDAVDDLNKALEIFNKIITEKPYRGLTEFAYYSAADCYSQLAQYDKSNQYYNKVLQGWPDFKYAWNAQFMIGRNYEKMAADGAVSQENANIQIKSAYETVISKYSDCKAAKIASRWLKKNK